MEENIQYAFITKDGKKHPINVNSVGNLTEAIFEIVANLMKGGVEADGKIYTVDDIVGYCDIPG